MATYEVPLSPSPQRFRIELAGVAYRMTLLWRDVLEGGWILDIADDNEVPILQGVPLVTGADLLAQYGYLGFGGQLIVQTDHETDDVPTFENLGVDSHLFFVTA